MKRVKKIVSIVLIIMLALNTAAFSVFAEDGIQTNEVTPAPSDYSISGSTITGLKTEFIATLTEVQKQNIVLEIPEKINEVTVTAISEKAFKHGVQEIRIIGTVILPETMDSIGKSAFYEQKSITSVDFSKCKLTKIGEGTFRYTGLKGTIILPGSVKIIETSAFASTGIDTVYLPKGLEKIVGNAFFDCGRLKDIICADYTDYQVISKQTFSNSGKLTCIFPINFRNAENTATLSKKTCLLLRAYNYEEQEDGSWCENQAYRFPQIAGKSWSNKKDVPSIRVEKDIIIITGNFLYQVNAIEKPVIMYSGGIDKIFDGKVATLSVKAEHPLSVPESEAQAGNVIFYYTWSWATIGFTPAVLEGYDENEYGIIDVRADYPISCTVKVQTCMLNSDNSVTVLYTDTHDFIVDLRQATPDLSKIPQGVVKVEESTTTLPTLPTVTGGTLTWDTGQTMKDGFNSYAWTFTPDKNGVGSTNYKPMKGKTLICPAAEEATADSVNEQIEKLPEINKDTVVDETIQNAILDAFITVECSGSDIKDSISEDKKDKIYDAIAKLPNVETKASEEAKIKTANLDNLIRNLTPEEAVLLKDQNTKLDISVKAEEKKPEADALAAIELVAPDIKIGASFDINIEKTIGSAKGNITELSKPITLTFDLPDEVKGQSDISLIRVHADNSGKLDAEVLPDLDTNPNTITVSTDKFSLYAIAYQEQSDDSSGGGTAPSMQYAIKATAGTGGKISPDGITSVYGGFSQTFTIMPDAGYHINKVLVDGNNVGTPKSYTFTDVRADHHIAVEFVKDAPSKNDKIKDGVKATTIKVSTKAYKGYNRVNWKKSWGYKVDGYQVYKSTKMTAGTFKFMGSTKQLTMKNAKGIKKGTKYYYKVRGYRIIDGVKVYTKWSNLGIRIAK